MRRTLPRSSAWATYRFKIAPPRAEGPAPVGSPQNMNSTKAAAFIDPIDDPFPTSIRGKENIETPPDQFVDTTFFLTSGRPFGSELIPWSQTAPEGSFRFRPHAEFDKTGRSMVEQLRASTKGAPMKEIHLARLAGQRRPAAPSPATLMDRAIQENHRRVPYVSAAEVQRDVGRVEAVKMPRDKSELASLFPFKWNTEDWYEYEVAKVRGKRFFCENESGLSPRASEVTYKLVLGSLWDHHCKHLVDDVTAFVRDVGRQVIQEKLNSVRSVLSTYSSTGSIVIDDATRNAFNSNGQTYDDDEIMTFMRDDLLALERECVRVLGQCNSFNSEFASPTEPGTTWPTVETLEPWKRMVEFWTQKADTTFGDAEMSTRKYEFRKFFRVVVIKMPFHSPDLERRIFDIRHWLHHRATIEFHTIHKKNLIFDQGKFPVEHDPVNKPTHDDHRMYSFALDWQQAPADFARTIPARENDTWEVLAEALTTSVDELKRANPGVTLSAGCRVVVPRGASSKIPATTRFTATFQLDGSVKTWEQAADAMNVTVQELQAANGLALAKYKDGFDASTRDLFWPLGSQPTHLGAFATREATFADDTFEKIAARLGTTVSELRTANPDVTDPRTVASVAVPSAATRKRPVAHPLSRTSQETSELFPSLEGVVAHRDLPREFPVEPAVAKNYPGEFADGSGSYPVQPRTLAASDSWLAYTAAYLDRDLSMKQEPQISYHLNRAWPEHAIPGTEQQTPFEEDQTWLLSNIPLQTHEMANPKQHLQDLPQINNEQFAVSMEQLRP